MNIKDGIDKAGGPRLVADRLGVRRQAVYQWMTKGIPPERGLAVAALAQVRRSDVDPLLYPPGLVA